MITRSWRSGGLPRIAITGIGVVSPFGVGRERYWAALARGESGTRRIEDFDTSAFACQVAAALPAFGIEDAPPLEGDNGNAAHVAGAPDAW